MIGARVDTIVGARIGGDGREILPVPPRRRSFFEPSDRDALRRSASEAVAGSEGYRRPAAALRAHELVFRKCCGKTVPLQLRSFFNLLSEMYSNP